jgi:hypothetical protein
MLVISDTWRVVLVVIMIHDPGAGLKAKAGILGLWDSSKMRGIFNSLDDL